MKDGIYRVTLTVDGQQVVAEAHVRNGVLQGLGELAGLVGVISAAEPSLPSIVGASTVDSGAADHFSWNRSDLDPGTAAPLVSGDASLAAEARWDRLARDLQRVREELDAICRNAVPIAWPAAGAWPTMGDSVDGCVYFCAWPDSGGLLQTRLHP